MTKLRINFDPIVLLADRMKPMTDAFRPMIDAFGPIKEAFDSFGTGPQRPLHLPQESEFPRPRLLSPDHRPPDILEKPKRGRPLGSPDDEFVSFGVDMVLCGEAKNAQEAARMVVDIRGFQPRSGPNLQSVQGSDFKTAIHRLAIKIRQALDG